MKQLPSEKSTQVFWYNHLISRAKIESIKYQCQSAKQKDSQATVLLLEYPVFQISLSAGQDQSLQAKKEPEEECGI